MVRPLLIRVAWFFAVLLPAGALWAQEVPTPEAIVAAVDEIRNPQADYSITVRVTSLKPKRDPQVSDMRVMISGREKAISITTAPPIDKGRILLMLGNDLWVYLPNLSKPLRLSMAERLMGDVANGDIVRVNFSGDYVPKLLRMEAAEGRDYFVLELVAKTEQVPYGRVLLWAERGTFFPWKAEFYALTGRLLKTASYENFREFGGRVRPTRVVMHNALFQDQVSTMEYDNVEIAPIPEKYFSKDYMKRLNE